jgi:hypothetical protein
MIEVGAENVESLKELERETGIEPATSSLGSCCLTSVQRKIKHLEQAMQGQVRH